MAWAPSEADRFRLFRVGNTVFSVRLKSNEVSETGHDFLFDFPIQSDYELATHDCAGCYGG